MLLAKVRFQKLLLVHLHIAITTINNQSDSLFLLNINDDNQLVYFVFFFLLLDCNSLSV